MYMYSPCLALSAILYDILALNYATHVNMATGTSLQFGLVSYEHLRSTFFNCLSDLDTSFTSLTPTDKFMYMYILSANSHCKIIGKHLYNIIKTRTQLLNL